MDWYLNGASVVDHLLPTDADGRVFGQLAKVAQSGGGIGVAVTGYDVDVVPSVVEQ